MRISLALTFFFIYINGFSQENEESQKIFAANEENLSSVLDRLKDTYGVKIFYKNNWIPVKDISVPRKTYYLSEVLDIVLSSSDLGFIKYDEHNYIILKKDDLNRNLSQKYFMLRNLELSENFEGSLITIGNLNNVEEDEKVIVQGTITSFESQEPLIGAVLSIPEIEISTVTDQSGSFSLEVPAGIHKLRVDLIGYDTKYLDIKVLSTDRLDIQLLEQALELEEITISGSYIDPVNSAEIGITQLSPKQLKELPSFLGEPDVIKSLLTLPGVSSIGEGASGFNVRGGNIDQNLILQDGGIIFNSAHALGFFSIFNADILDNVTLYKGHIPAQYGGRLSSVLKVETKDGSFEKLAVNGGLGAVTSRLTVETPVVKERISLFLSGRTSYSDWIIRRFPDLRESSVFFYDVNGKLSARLSKSATLGLNYNRSFDQFDFDSRFGFESIGENLSVNYFQSLVPGLLDINTQLAYGNTRNTGQDDDLGSTFSIQTGLEYFKIRQDFLLNPFEKHELTAGGEWILYDISPEVLNPTGPGSSIVPERVEKDRGEEFAFYINDNFNLNSVWSFAGGLRYSRFNHLGEDSVFIFDENIPRSSATVIDTLSFESGETITSYDAFEPRFSVKYGFSNNSSVKLSYNRIFQYLHLVSNSAAAVPIDFWQPSTLFIPPQSANSYSIGYFRDFNPFGWESSLEVFYKDFDNLIQFTDFADLSLNNTLEADIVSASGESYGAEFLLKKNSGNITGSLSYTFVRIFNTVRQTDGQESINGGNRFPANFDKPHTVNLALKIQSNKQSYFTMNFSYSSGRPVNAPGSIFSVSGIIIPDFVERNSFRIPDYHRLDVAYTFSRSKIKNQRYKSSFTISIFNLYARDNAFSIFFGEGDDGRPEAFQLSVLQNIFPSVTYNFNF